MRGSGHVLAVSCSRQIKYSSSKPYLTSQDLGVICCGHVSPFFFLTCVEIGMSVLFFEYRKMTFLRTSPPQDTPQVSRPIPLSPLSSFPSFLPKRRLLQVPHSHAVKVIVSGEAVRPRETFQHLVSPSFPAPFPTSSTTARSEKKRFSKQHG